MNRRQALRGLVAGFALCTGLAKARLEMEPELSSIEIWMFGTPHSEEHWVARSDYADMFRYDADLSFDGEVVRIGELGEFSGITMVENSTVRVDRVIYSHNPDF